MRFPLLRPLLALALLAASLPSLALDSNKWRLQCSGGANADGVITLRITPKGGAPTEVAVAIKDRAGENAVARAIRDALKAQVGDRYKVETDDGEDVLVKKRGRQPDFEIAVVSNTVKGVRVNSDRE
ncbi:MAG: hypothetical protein KA280_10780 [Thermomonas sp.]|nr:hypothetical protein [Thermomonas sp.]